MLKCLYGLVKSIAITWITIKLLSLVPLLMSKVAQTINDTLASTKGSVAVVGSSSTVAWNIESIIDKLSVYGGVTLLILSIIATVMTIRAHKRKREREKIEDAQRDELHKAQLKQLKEMSDADRMTKEVQAELLKIALKKYPDENTDALEEIIKQANVVELKHKTKG